MDAKRQGGAPPVAVHPPVLLAAVLGLGLGLDRALGLELAAGPLEPVRLPAGVVLVALGVMIAGAAVRRFWGTGTAVPTWRPALALATAGIYAHTRNPMYLGMLVALLGLAVTLASPALLALWPLTAVVLDRAVVRREEAYLDALFGQPYRDYRNRVPRWL